eukprot:g36552.t1
MGLALLLRNTPNSWTIPYYLSFVEKFAKKSTFDHKSIRKWSAGELPAPVRSFMYAWTLCATKRYPQSGCRDGIETVTDLLLKCAFAKEISGEMQWFWS